MFCFKKDEAKIIAPALICEIGRILRQPTRQFSGQSLFPSSPSPRLLRQKLVLHLLILRARLGASQRILYAQLVLDVVLACIAVKTVLDILWHDLLVGVVILAPETLNVHILGPIEIHVALKGVEVLKLFRVRDDQLYDSIKVLLVADVGFLAHVERVHHMQRVNRESLIELRPDAPHRLKKKMKIVSICWLPDGARSFFSPAGGEGGWRSLQPGVSCARWDNLKCAPALEVGKMVYLLFVLFVGSVVVYELNEDKVLPELGFIEKLDLDDDLQLLAFDLCRLQQVHYLVAKIACFIYLFFPGQSTKKKKLATHKKIITAFHSP